MNDSVTISPGSIDSPRGQQQDGFRKRVERRVKDRPPACSFGSAHPLSRRQPSHGDLSGQPLPQSPACSPVAELCSCLGLFAVGLAINIALVQCANAQFWLTGEEASVAFKDVVFLRLRLQHGRYDTNLGGHILYFLAHVVHPDPGLWYGRESKAILMALAGPLTYLFARRLGLGFRGERVFRALHLPVSY